MNREIISNMHYFKGSDYSYKTSNKNVKDNEDLRLAKQQKLRLAPAYKGLTLQPQNLTLPLVMQIKVTLRYNNQLES